MARNLRQARPEVGPLTARFRERAHLPVFRWRELEGRRRIPHADVRFPRLLDHAELVVVPLEIDDDVPK